MKTNIILNGDAISELKKLPDESIDCVMTSPPYWALRDYGVDNQLGLESTFEEYINKLCDIFDEIKRVLKKSGTCWVNLGDTYSTQSGAMRDGKFGKKNTNNQQLIQPKVNLPGKCLLQIPSRFAIEMTNRGWILRNKIIWYKPNCMPESVKDRFTNDFEYLFFFSKNKKYYFATQYEKLISNAERGGGKKIASMGSKWGGQGLQKWKIENSSQGRNKRTVWQISLKPFKEAHFAVYPEELCETPIKACCPEDGIVLDPFFGSGTTGLVTLKQNKKFIGIELNKEYIEIANKRLKPYLEQKQLSA